MKPQAIYFCNAYPLTEQDFHAGSGKDFIQLYIRHKSGLGQPASWQEYEKEIVIPYQLFKKSFISYGFNFRENFSFSDFCQLLSSDEQELVILFTHCRDGGLPCERVEFFDGLAAWNCMLDAIPPSSDFILDLAVCNPQYLAKKIRVLRPACVTRYAETSISIALWILYYAELFRQILELENYFLAYEATVYQFLDK